jgi:hypothetical protein
LTYTFFEGGKSSRKKKSLIAPQHARASSKHLRHIEGIGSLPTIAELDTNAIFELKACLEFKAERLYLAGKGLEKRRQPIR